MKQLTSHTGVYEVVNKVNGHKYVGSSKNIKKRRGEHKCNLRGNHHANNHLQSAWNLYGEDSFEFRILAILEPFERLRIENLLLATGVYVYNIATDASAPPPMKGKHHSEATKAKIGKAHTGKHHTEEAKRKISEAQIGRCHSEDSKRKMSVARAGKNHPMWGKKHSEESKRKMSKAQMGRIHSEETKRKISKAQKGEKNHNYGKHPTKEAKAKMSKARKAYWINKRIKEGITV